MPSCVVSWCKNKSDGQRNIKGLTFHKFPMEHTWRCEWIKIIRHCRNEDDWMPSKFSVVCSDHFDEDDLYYNKKGTLRRVKKNRVPTNVCIKVVKNNPPPEIKHETEMDVEISAENVGSEQADPLNTGHVIALSEIKKEKETEYYEVAIDGVVQQIKCEPDTEEPVNICVSKQAHVSNIQVNQILPVPSTTIVPSTKQINITIQHVEKESKFETLEIKYLRKKLEQKKEAIVKSRKIIRTLKQKVRRLTKRNVHLKEILEKIKQQSKDDEVTIETADDSEDEDSSDIDINKDDASVNEEN